MKTLAVGVLIAAVILLGVFCPTFSMQILNGILLLAIFLVLGALERGLRFRDCGNALFRLKPGRQSDSARPRLGRRSHAIRAA